MTAYRDWAKRTDQPTCAVRNGKFRWLWRVLTWGREAMRAMGQGRKFTGGSQ